MKIMSFNVNGIRARPHQMQALFEGHGPDILGLQEIKVRDEEFPLEPLVAAGYHVFHFGQKSHYGVALLSKSEPVSVRLGFPGDEPDAQRRMISATFELASGKQLHVLNGYFPQGSDREHPIKFPAKRRFYEDLDRFLSEHFSAGELVAVMGDFNIAPNDTDIGIGEANAKRWLRTGKCSFLPEERGWWARLLDWGLQDTYRQIHPEVTDRYSWFDYRSRGFDGDPKRGLRIDTVLATAPLAAACRDAGIDYEIRAMERPSDHCPVWAKFDL